MSLKDRILANSKPLETGCRLWLGGVSGSGYGIMSVANRSQLVHRISYQEFRGPIPPGQCVLHECDVRICVNPEHFFLGTKGENNSDRKKKGRNAPREGENNTQVKLSDSEVLEIRRLVDSERITQREIAEQFGVTQSTISAIKLRQIWTHI